MKNDKPLDPIYYFGCIREAGHYLYSSNGWKDYSLLDTIIPWRYKVDGNLCPPDMSGQYEIEGLAMLHYKDGWTALAFWDRSVDHRHKSNSCFLAPGYFSFEEMLKLAKEYFPSVMKRFSFSIVLAVTAPPKPINNVP
jgi:hypothetical protein